MQNALNWFEIPAADLDRAARFYERVFDAPLRREKMCDAELAVFPYAETGVGGSLIAHANIAPRDNGTLVYLNAGEDLSPLLGRVEAAGGRIAMPKTEITPEIGYIALFIDSEGNRVGLHSPR